MTTPLLEATVEAIAESDNEIGGLRVTRLTAAVAAGATTFPVESTLDWPEVGVVGVGGVQYRYSSRTIFALVGITYRDAGVDVAGAVIDHRVETPVIDKSRTFSGLDQVRAALLVDTAVGDDLNALGRNLGVLRLPFVGDDDTFREIIKALAYNPRGTIYGMELALDAMVGAGNYEIIEDLKIDNNTVKIRIFSASADAESQGKAFLPSLACSASAGLDLSLPEAAIAIGGVRLAPESHLTITTAQKPSAELYVEENCAVNADTWVYSGPSEAANVTLVPGEYIDMLDSSNSAVSYYERYIRCTGDGEWGVSVLFTVPSGTTLFTTPASDPDQLGVRVVETHGVDNQGHQVGWGILGVSGTTYAVGIFGGPSAFVSSAILTMGDYHEITLRRTGTSLNLYVDGDLVETQDVSGFTLGSTNAGSFRFGSLLLGRSGQRWRVKQVGWFTQVSLDHWSDREGGDVVTASPRLFTSTHVPVGASQHDFLAGDVGRQLRIQQSGITNALGGNNNGVYDVESVDADDQLTLRGATHGDGLVANAGDLFRSAADIRRFSYPQDLGKTLVIDAGVNAGTYTVAAILEEGTLVDFASFATPNAAQSGLAKLTDGGPPAALSPESGRDWRLDPAFVTEVGVLQWELSDAGSLAGATATFRTAPPVGSQQNLYEIFYSTVLSGQTLLDELVSNLLLSEDPLAFTFYPFYISDPLGFVRAYLDEITVAGVIPEFID